MATSSQFASVAITPAESFSWVFFVDWLLAFSIVICIMFYFNRFVGLVLTTLLRWTAWRSQKVKVDVQSVKFSFLAGRVFFKNLTIVDKDATISALRGSLTWRYWLPKVRRRKIDLTSDEEGGINFGANSLLPSRFVLEIDGLELFIYNRTVSYDNILQNISGEFEKGGKDESKEFYDVFSQLESDATTNDNSNVQSSPTNRPQDDLPPSIMTKLFPIQMKVNRGSIVAGNKKTHAVLILSYDKLNGNIDMKRSLNTLDHGCQSFEFSLQNLEVSLKPNILHERSLNDGAKIPARSSGRRGALLHQVVKLWNLFTPNEQSTQSKETWKGLSQYLDTENPPDSDTTPEETEYGKYTGILTAAHCDVQYYFDFPGLVNHKRNFDSTGLGLDVGNGGSSPEFGLEVVLSSATIHYGPWADRQRHTLQQMVLPTVCRDGIPQPKLADRQRRIHTNFTLRIDIKDECILRIPTREASKDEDYKSTNGATPISIRPFGWIELKVASNSRITSINSLVASKSGYENKIEANLLDLEARSSVNHDIFFKCGKHVVIADIGYPLGWNKHAVWTLLNESNGVEAYLLREHITLLSDLFTDFGAGIPTPYELFRPFSYSFNWNINDYKLFFNVNDANIVNNPLDFNDNIYLSIQGEELRAKVQIPLDSIAKRSTTIDYAIETAGFSLVLDTPPWHTLNNFLKSKELGRSKAFTVDGSYTYYPELGLDNVETIVIACQGNNVVLMCYGFIVKYIMSIKENYFGDFTRFKTLEEYTSSLNDAGSDDGASETLDESYSFKRTENETDVHFSFCVDDSCIVLPANLYDASSNFSFLFDDLDIDIRFTNYYMDMQVDMTQAEGYHVPSCKPGELFDLKTFEFPETHEMIVDDLSIHGHRMFGLPPDEPTCFCKWDITPGPIAFSGTTKALEAFVSSLIKLGFGYKNLENELLLVTPELFDTTGVNISLPKLNVNLKEPDIKETVGLEIKSIVLKAIDYTNARYTKRVSVDVKDITMFVRDLASGRESLRFQTALRFTNFCLSQDYEEVKVKQEDHIIKHDGPFHRIPFLLDERIRAGYDKSFAKIIPSFSLPDGNPALINENVDAIFADIGISSGFEDVSIHEEDHTQNFIRDFDQDTTDSTCPHWESIAGVRVKPLSSYEDEDFNPILKPDPTFETDNFILNFGDINGLVSLHSLFVLLGLFKRYSNKSVLSILDDLHLAVLKRLDRRLTAKPISANVRLVAPVLNLSLTESSWATNAPNLASSDHLSIAVVNPSVAFSKSKDVESFKESMFAIHLQNINANLNQGLSSKIGLKVLLEDFEVWSHNLENEVTSVALNSADVVLEPTVLDWVVEYITELRSRIDTFVIMLKQYVTAKKVGSAEILYEIATGSIQYKIEHDPAVITRPAYIIRLSKKHIRANDSWKVIARLRHIYENLPKDWLDSLETKKSKDQLTLPPTAMNDVVQIFTQWRTWEFTDISNSFIFRYVFDDKDTSHFVDSVKEVFIDSLAIRVLDTKNNNIVDFKGIAFLESSTLNKEDPDHQNVEKSSSLRVENAKVFLQPLSYDLNLLDLSSQKVGPTSLMVAAKQKMMEHHIVFSAGSLDVEICFNETSLLVKGKESITSALILGKGEGGTLVLNSKLSHFQVSGYLRSQRIYHHVTSKFKCFLFGSTSDFQRLTIDTSSELSTFDLTNSTCSFACFLQSLGQDAMALSKIARKLKLSSDQQGTSSFDLSLLNIAFRYKNKLVKWNGGLFDPVIVKCTSNRLEVAFKLERGVVLSELILGDGRTKVSMIDKKFIFVESLQKGLDLSSKYDIAGKELELDLNLGSSSVVFGDIFANYDLVSRSFTAISDSISEISRSLATLKSQIYQPSSSVAKMAGAPSILNVKSLKITTKYLLAGVSSRSTLFSFSMNHIVLDYSDIIVDAKLTKPHGELEVESTQLTISNKRVNMNLSNVLDFSFGLKLLKPSEKEQTLQLKSSYSRLVLSSGTVIKLIQLKNDISYLTSRIKSDHPNTSPSSSAEAVSFIDIFKFSSVHVLSYNFCMGFVFDDATPNSPGLIAGCEKLFAIAEGSFGKLSLINSYFSVAKGKTSKDFFSISEEYESPNRAFLPNMQIIYAVAKSSSDKDVQIRVTGEELDVKFVTSSIVFIEQLLNSIATIEHLKQTLPRYTKDVLSTNTHSQDMYVSLPPDVTSINCEMNFAGGVVKIFRWEDFEPIDNYTPAFELRTPAVKILTSYSKALGLKEHLVNLDVYTFSSSNTLHSSCVPVLIDVWDCFKQLGSQSGPKSELKSEEKVDGSPFDWVKLISKFQVHLSLHIDKQELILSCEPSAKVQAVVGIGSIDIRMMTNEEDDSSPVAGSISIEDVGASLQHSFSRETSGSIGINELLLTGVLSGHKNVKFYGGVKCDKVSAYLNLKQLQDVNLFTALWVPSSSTVGESDKSLRSVATVITQEEHLVLKFHRVSKNKLIPWTLDFLVRRLECEVDLGKSLGMLSLEIDKIWAFSRKKSDHEQDMVIGLNSIAFRSRGRLSGHLLINNIRLHTVIKWSLVEDTTEAPIVVLSVGFDCIEAKASFDYNTFLIGRVSKSHITVYNQADKVSNLQDAIFAGTKCESVELYITTFAASNILDVYNTLTRIRQDNRRSYRENLKTFIDDHSNKKAQDIIDVIATLKTELEVDWGSCLLHVYPGSFLDSQALVIVVGGLAAHFEQQLSTVTKKLETNLRLQVDDIIVSLSSYKSQISEETLVSMTIAEFIQHSKLAKGGMIFCFPSLGCSMKTSVFPNSPTIDYAYKSSFGGKVDVRWNLGSVQFIKEMWMIHTKALSAKLSMNYDKSAQLYKAENIEEKIIEAELNDKYRYFPIEPPIIEAPQLRDLGDATPPLEWFGLHRQKFPGFTHQLVIVPLQKLAHEVELQYGRVLGKA